MIKKTLALLALKATAEATQLDSIDCNQSSTDGSLIKSSNGKFYKVYCNVDLDNHGLVEASNLTASECVEACSLTDGCVALSYLEEIKTCYLKNGAGFPTFPDLGGLSVVSLDYAPLATSNYSCSTSNKPPAALYDSGYKYVITCNANYPSNDIAHYPALTLEECNEKCSAVTECAGVVYTGHCYLKSAFDTSNKVEVSGYLTARRTDPCPFKNRGNYDAPSGKCIDECPKNRSKTIRSTDGKFFCSSPCYKDLFYDVSNQKCVFACGDDQTSSTSDDIKLCTNKATTTTSSFVSRNVMMMKKRN